MFDRRCSCPGSNRSWQWFPGASVWLAADITALARATQHCTRCRHCETKTPFLTLGGVTDAELIELLGGGKVGAKRLAQLQRRSRYLPVFGTCQRCGRLFVNVRFFYLAHDEFRPAGFDGLE